MFSINDVLIEHGLDKERYESLLSECYKIVTHETDKRWDDICAEYGIPYSAEAIRKAQQLPLFGGAFIKQYMEEKPVSGADTCSDFEERKRELEIARVKYQDERNAWAKQTREYARLERFLDMLGASIGPITPIYFNTPIYTPEKRTMIVCLSDWHIGESFYNTFGEYDVGVARERLEKLSKKAYVTAIDNKVEKIILVCLGDMISGNIHKNIQITNSENVVDQVKIAAEYLTSFCESMCRLDNVKVELHSVAGNHSRLDKKEDALLSERLDDLIPYIVFLKLKDYDNFIWEESAFNYNIDAFPVYDKYFVAVHGDLDSANPVALAKLSAVTGITPYCVLKGHNHSPAYTEINGIQVVQSGCLPGSGGQFSVEKRLVGKPSQSILICDKHGIVSVSHVNLDLVLGEDF